jgi:hypothetical protein
MLKMRKLLLRLLMIWDLGTIIGLPEPLYYVAEFLFVELHLPAPNLRIFASLFSVQVEESLENLNLVNIHFNKYLMHEYIYPLILQS